MLDLILTLDSSGSFKVDDFEVLHIFVANPTSTYQPQYFDHDSMKLGNGLWAQALNLSIRPAPLVEAWASVHTDVAAPARQPTRTNLKHQLHQLEMQLEDGEQRLANQERSFETRTPGEFHHTAMHGR